MYVPTTIMATSAIPPIAQPIAITGENARLVVLEVGGISELYTGRERGEGRIRRGRRERGRREGGMREGEEGGGRRQGEGQR